MTKTPAKPKEIMLRTTPERREAFLKVIRETGSMMKAAEATASPTAGKQKAWSTWDYLKKTDPTFAAAFSEAMDSYYAALHSDVMDKVVSRVLKGDSKIVAQKGAPVFITDKDGNRRPLVETRYSDALTLALLRKLDPSFRETVNTFNKNTNINISDDDGSFSITAADVMALTAGQRAALFPILKAVKERRDTRNFRERTSDAVEAVDVPFIELKDVTPVQSELDKWIQSEGDT